jgi:hypothetical protein
MVGSLVDQPESTTGNVANPRRLRFLAAISAACPKSLGSAGDPNLVGQDWRTAAGSRVSIYGGASQSEVLEPSDVESVSYDRTGFHECFFFSTTKDRRRIPLSPKDDSHLGY